MNKHPVRRITDLEDQLSKIRLDLASVDESIQKLDTETQRQEEQLSESSIELPRRVSNREASISKMLEELETFSNSLTNLTVLVANIKKKLDSNVFRWVVEDFVTKKQSLLNGTLDVVVSESFYSHIQGYNLKLYMQKKDFDGVAFLSLFAYLVPGENDAILEWPFKKCFTLRLISSNGLAENLDKCVNERELRQHEDKLKRPAEDCNGGGIGFERFLMFDQLDNGYVEEDRLVVEFFLNV